MTSIEVDKNNSTYSSIDGNLYTKDGKQIVQYAIGKYDGVFEIPSQVTNIWWVAFWNAINLNKIIIHKNVSTIGQDAFHRCTSLTEIYVDPKNTKYCSIDGNLYDSKATTLISYAYGKDEDSFTVPSTVTTIGRRAFDLSSLVEIILPEGLTTIGFESFA